MNVLLQGMQFGVTVLVMWLDVVMMQKIFKQYKKRKLNDRTRKDIL